MIKQKVTILLMGLMCLSPVSGLRTVICRGSDGHVAVEHTVHNHCACAQIEEISSAGLSADHGHCEDTIVTSSLIIPARKNIRISSDVTFAPNFAPSTLVNYGPSDFGRIYSQSHDLSSFHTPLWT